MENRTIGEIGYEAYRQFTGGKSLVSGQDIPEFAKLSAAIKNAWEAAADHIVAFVGRADAGSATTGVKHE